jgi:steroid 5-alpha reductase family enzyme
MCVLDAYCTRACSLVASLFVLLWSARLGWFLFTRIQRDGKDSRFDAIKSVHTAAAAHQLGVI